MRLIESLVVVPLLSLVCIDALTVHTTTLPQLLPLRYLVSMFGETPTVIRGVCLLRDHGNACNTTVSPRQLLDAAKQLNGTDGNLLGGAVEMSPSPEVVYSDMSKPLAKVKRLQGTNRQGKRVFNQTAEWLLDRFADPTEALWYYHSSPAGTLLTNAMRRLLRTEAFRVDPGVDAHVHTSENVWLGARGVTAASHYDSSVNLYVQLHGAKTFILSSASTAAQEYSYLHPRFRRSQRQIYDLPNVTQVTLTLTLTLT